MWKTVLQGDLGKDILNLDLLRFEYVIIRGRGRRSLRKNITAQGTFLHAEHHLGLREHYIRFADNGLFHSNSDKGIPEGDPRYGKTRLRDHNVFSIRQAPNSSPVSVHILNETPSRTIYTEVTLPNGSLGFSNFELFHKGEIIRRERVELIHDSNRKFFSWIEDDKHHHIQLNSKSIIHCELLSEPERKTKFGYWGTIGKITLPNAKDPNNDTLLATRGVLLDNSMRSLSPTTYIYLDDRGNIKEAVVPLSNQPGIKIYPLKETELHHIF